MQFAREMQGEGRFIIGAQSFLHRSAYAYDFRPGRLLRGLDPQLL